VQHSSLVVVPCRYPLALDAFPFPVKTTSLALDIFLHTRHHLAPPARRGSVKRDTCTLVFSRSSTLLVLGAIRSTRVGNFETSFIPFPTPLSTRVQLDTQIMYDAPSVDENAVLAFLAFSAYFSPTQRNSTPNRAAKPTCIGLSRTRATEARLPSD